MTASTQNDVQAKLPEAYDPSVAIKVVEVARKYNAPEDQKIERIPEYTVPGGPNNYHCSKIETSWTQGFFPGLLWLLVERERLSPSTGLSGNYEVDEVTQLARRWQDSFRHLARPAVNHDQGFRYQLSFGRDFVLTGSDEAKKVVIEAAESLIDRFDSRVGCIRSWDAMKKTHSDKHYGRDNMDEHYLVIIDNMMNLDMMYMATELTGDQRYADVANAQAEKTMHTHIRPDWTTFHVVNYDPKTGKVLEQGTHQGYADDSCWSRGQAWGIYGFAQCALRTGRKDFADVACKLTDAFLDRLGPLGVPEWDFHAPKPCPYDASAAAIAARGTQMLYQLLKNTDAAAAEAYLAKGIQLMQDTIRECYTPKASLDNGGKVDFGQGGWETILQHSTINGNQYATRRLMDHGLIYADYYFVEYGNEALKLQKGIASHAVSPVTA